MRRGTAGGEEVDVLRRAFWEKQNCGVKFGVGEGGDWGISGGVGGRGAQKEGASSNGNASKASRAGNDKDLARNLCGIERWQLQVIDRVEDEA